MSTGGLLDRCTDAYWDQRHDSRSLQSPERMQAVMLELAHEIRRWAIDPQQGRLVHRAVHDIADRLILEAEISDKNQHTKGCN